MDPQEYARMHALETNYWWFVGRRAIVARLLQEVREEWMENRVRFEEPPCAARGDAPQATRRLLDIGCGTGANLPMLRSCVENYGHVTGLDFSPLALRFARRHLESSNASLVRGDGLRLPFRTDGFDAVTMLDVLEHLSDDRRALREVHRVLRPGGALVWSVPAYQRLWSAHDEALHHFRRYEYHALRRLLRDSGFKIQRISFAMSLMPPAAWAWRRFVLPFKPRRPRDAKRHSEGAVLPAVSPALNHALIAYLALEGRLIARRPLRFGTSLVGIARRAGE
jgi:SAM-dependent methyltransferase